MKTPYLMKIAGLKTYPGNQELTQADFDLASRLMYADLEKEPFEMPGFVVTYNCPIPMIWASPECRGPLTSARGGLLRMNNDFDKTIIGTHYISKEEVLKKTWEDLQEFMDKPLITIIENI